MFTSFVAGNWATYCTCTSDSQLKTVLEVVLMLKKGKICLRAEWPIRPSLNSSFCSMKRLGMLLLPLDGMLVHRRVPSMKRLGMLLLPLDGMLVHRRVPSMKRLGMLLLPLDGMLVHRRVPSMKRLGVLLLPLDGMLVHRRVPSMKQLGMLLLPLDGMLVHCRAAPSILSGLPVWVPTDTPRCMERDNVE